MKKFLKSVKNWQNFVMSLSPRFLAHPVLIDIAKFVHIVCFCSCGIHATTTTTLWPLYRSVCVSRHLQLWTGGFCWCKVLLPPYPCCQHPAHSVGEKTMKFCSALLIYLLSCVYRIRSNTLVHSYVLDKWANFDTNIFLHFWDTTVILLRYVVMPYSVLGMFQT